MPERPQSVDSSLGGSKRWSCGTLEEGIEHVQGAAHNKSKSLEEEQLLRELQDRNYIKKPMTIYVVLIWKFLCKSSIIIVFELKLFSLCLFLSLSRCFYVLT